MEKSKGAGTLEQVATTIFGLRQWLFNSWRIIVLLGKGAYLLAERRRLFIKLGEDTYERIMKGEIRNKDLEPTVNLLDRITKKVQIEETLIRRLRFGKHPGRSSRPPPQETGKSEIVVQHNLEME